jgi:hypothetical protein
MKRVGYGAMQLAGAGVFVVVVELDIGRRGIKPPLRESLWIINLTW